MDTEDGVSLTAEAHVVVVGGTGRQGRAAVAALRRRGRLFERWYETRARRARDDWPATAWMSLARTWTSPKPRARPLEAVLRSSR